MYKVYVYMHMYIQYLLCILHTLIKKIQFNSINRIQIEKFKKFENIELIYFTKKFLDEKFILPLKEMLQNKGSSQNA